MQSDGSSFSGDVVVDIFNKASRDEDNILDQMHKRKYVYTAEGLKPNFMSFLLCTAFLLICIFLFAFILLVLNAFFINICHVKAVQDDISEKTVPIWLHDTVLHRLGVGHEGWQLLRDEGRDQDRQVHEPEGRLQLLHQRGATGLSVCLMSTSWYLSVCLFVYLSTSWYLSVFLFFCLTVCPSVCLSVYLIVSPSVCLSVYIMVCPSVSQVWLSISWTRPVCWSVWFVRLVCLSGLLVRFVCLLVCLLVCMLICLFFCLLVCLAGLSVWFVCLFVCLPPFNTVRHSDRLAITVRDID